MLKKIVFSSGAISIMLIVLGYLFKIMHWAFAHYLFVIGVGAFALIFIPSLAKYLYLKEK